jgi:hypothetical protein
MYFYFEKDVNNYLYKNWFIYFLQKLKIKFLFSFVKIHKIKILDTFSSI